MVMNVYNSVTSMKLICVLCSQLWAHQGASGLYKGYGTVYVLFTLKARVCMGHFTADF